MDVIVLAICNATVKKDQSFTYGGREQQRFIANEIGTKSDKMRFI